MVLAASVRASVPQAAASSSLLRQIVAFENKPITSEFMSSALWQSRVVERMKLPPRGGAANFSWSHLTWC